VKKTHYRVRTAVLEDAVHIGHVQAQSWKSTYKGIVHDSYLDAINAEERAGWSENRIINSAEDVLVLVEQESNKIIGFAYIGKCREKNVAADGEIHAIYLYQEFQGKGGGKLLFSEAVARLKKKNYLSMMVSVLTENRSGCAFYEKLGGRYIGVDKVVIEDYSYATSTYFWEKL
jgi:L-amino acid N-acyltransferase YncA